MSIGKSAVVELKVGSFSISVKNRLAEGGFGFVDLVYETSSKQEYVLKRAGIERPEIYEIVKKEINILQRFSGPHMVKLLASDVIVVNKGKKEACLLLEFCPGGHLLERLNNRGGKHLPPASVYKIFGQLLLALKPMHESMPPVTHRDLKLENILFGTDGNVRLCDFGSCVVGPVYVRNADEKAAAEEIIGKETTQMYRSPEMVDLYMRDVLTEKSDIWALGCILYTLCFLAHPFQDMGSLGILSARISMPANVPLAPEVKTMLMRMLDVDPEARPSVPQLLAAFGAVATGKPLPHYEVPVEAIERRKEREITAKKREEKNKASMKKLAPKIVPVKATGPLDSNSVAARRLAMKKGGSSSNPSGSSIEAIDCDTNNVFEADFGNDLLVNVVADSPPRSQPSSTGSRGTAFSSSSAFGQEEGNGEFNFDAFGASDSPTKNSFHDSQQQSLPLQTENFFEWDENRIEGSGDKIDHSNTKGSSDDFFSASFGNFENDSQNIKPFTPSPINKAPPVSNNFSATSSVTQPLATTEKLESEVNFFDTDSPPRASPLKAPVPLHSTLPSTFHPTMVQRKSVPCMLPSYASYEPNLLDTTPGPPELDFLSMETRKNSSPSQFPSVSREQAIHVLGHFDNPSGHPSTSFAQSSCPDLSKLLGNQQPYAHGMAFPHTPLPTPPAMLQRQDIPTFVQSNNDQFNQQQRQSANKFY